MPKPSLSRLSKGERFALWARYPTSPDAVVKLIKKLGDAASLRVGYEAGPHRLRLVLAAHAPGVHCDVIAPSLVPKIYTHVLRRGPLGVTSPLDAVVAPSVSRES
jgi:hypothetical protein